MNDHTQIFASRVFSVADGYDHPPEWYCLTREEVMGPYASERLAREALAEFISLCQALSWNCDREPGQQERRRNQLPLTEAS